MRRSAAFEAFRKAAILIKIGRELYTFDRLDEIRSDRCGKIRNFLITQFDNVIRWRI